METFEFCPPPPPHPMCVFSLGEFHYFFAGAGGVCGLLLNGIFFWGGCMFGPIKTGNSFGGWGILKFKCFWGTFDTYILRKGCGAK